MQFKVHHKEETCTWSMIIMGAFFYLFSFPILLEMFMTSLGDAITVVFGVLFFIAYQVIPRVFLLGYLRGNAIAVNGKQFPEVFEIIKNQSQRLGLATVPDFYLLQGGGLLNAFAARLVGKNHVVLYSDIFALAYQEGLPAVEFIIGHELGHIKRNHVGGWKQWLMMPAKLIPFLSNAYSRSCEYTCDSIGFALCPEGARQGMLILASGTQLYKKIDIKALLAHGHNENGFSLWLAEVFSTHPHLIRRMANIERMHSEHITFTGAMVARHQGNSVQEGLVLNEPFARGDVQSKNDKNPLL